MDLIVRVFKQLFVLEPVNAVDVGRTVHGRPVVQLDVLPPNGVGRRVRSFCALHITEHRARPRTVDGRRTVGLDRFTGWVVHARFQTFLDRLVVVRGRGGGLVFGLRFITNDLHTF